MPRRSVHTFSLSGNLVALLALIFVVWTSVTVALPTLDDPVATTVALSDWQGSSESSEGASSPGDVSSLSPTFVYPPSALRGLVTRRCVVAVAHIRLSTVGVDVPRPSSVGL